MVVIHDVAVEYAVRECRELSILFIIFFSFSSLLTKLRICHFLPQEFRALLLVAGGEVEDERNPQRKTHFEV